MTIDLNCDLGELADGALEEALMAHITSANVACGGHSGDAESMRRTVEMARRHGLAVGAHPGYPDRANFGRVEMGLSGEQIAETERALPGPGSNLTRKGSRRYGYFVSACLRSLSSLSTSSSLLITSASPFSSMRAVQE